jgi:hypothetical protein
VLVNNAGNFYAGFFEEIRPQDFRAQVETTLFGPINLTRAVLSVMRAQRSGLVVAISSTVGIVGQPFCTAYAAAKFGVEGWIESLAPEVTPFGIRTMLVGRAEGQGPPGPGRRLPRAVVLLGLQRHRRSLGRVAVGAKLMAVRVAVHKPAPDRTVAVELDSAPDLSCTESTQDHCVDVEHQPTDLVVSAGCVRWWVSDVVSGLQHVWGGLPQLDPVAFGVDQPGEPADAFLCLRAVDPDPGRTELGHHGVQVADAEVEHPRLLGAAEVVGVGGKRHEHRGAPLLPPDRVTTLQLVVDPEVPGVPAGERVGVTGAKEHAADAGDSLHELLRGWLPAGQDTISRTAHWT